MKTLIIVLLCLSFWSSFLYSMNGGIFVKGKIYMQRGEIPIKDAILELKDSTGRILQKAISNDFGDFKFHIIPKTSSGYELFISNEVEEYIINHKKRGKSNEDIWDISIKEKIEKIDDLRRLTHLLISIFTVIILMSIWFFYSKSVVSG